MNRKQTLKVIKKMQDVIDEEVEKGGDNLQATIIEQLQENDMLEDYMAFMIREAEGNKSKYFWRGLWTGVIATAIILLVIV